MQIPHKLIIASHNRYKVNEIKNILKEIPINLVSLADLNWESNPEETGSSYYDNALLKVKSIVSHFHIPAIGEDSGLEVDALNGAPGIYSARYAGENASQNANNIKLLQALKDRPFPKRTARFCCTIVLLFPNKKIFSWKGICEGFITFEPKGSFGFGYDPLFFIPKYQKTFAELSPEIKNKVSHRTQALNQLRYFFRELY